VATSFTFFLEGTIIDGLGYLNRLFKRANEFEQMSFDVLGARHPFGFSAGVVSVAYDEFFESVNKRVSECLGVAIEEGSRLRVYWVESEMPERITPFQKKILEETDALFGKNPLGERNKDVARSGLEINSKA
jgi:hypothetical protein